MADPQIVYNMETAILELAHPAVTRWNRLEGRPRTHNFDRALRAEVRDALWMIAKQWQMGEFQGNDAGSPALARTCIDLMSIDRFQAAQGRIEPFDLTEPLEARVERRPLPLRLGAQYLSLDLRLAAGRRWMKLLAGDFSAGRLTRDYRSAYRDAYPVKQPNPADRADAAIAAHPDVWQQVAAAAGRLMDGVALLERLDQPGATAFENVGADPADEAPLTALAGRLRAWLNELIFQPSGSETDAWLPERLEYQFGVSARDESALPGGDPDAGDQRGAEIVLRAEEYHGGRMDWYALEHHTQEDILGKPFQPPLPRQRRVHTFLPAPVVFEGMPSTRWWAFEDRRTNFGELRPDSTDLGKLLLMEFALVYANDWFVLPYALPVGSLAEARGIAVSNVFDERFWIEPAPQAPPADWSRWRMFQLSVHRAGLDEADRRPPPSRLALLPVTPKIQESAPVEAVSLVRDELANMVWAIEKRIPLPSGASKPGTEAARELLGFLQQPLREKLWRIQARKAVLEAIPEADRTQAEQDELNDLIDELKALLPPDPAAPVRYRVMNTVPEEWIPFIPVHQDGSSREIQLQRATQPRLLEGSSGPVEKVRPRTALLSQNLPRAYFIFEEEVPRAGAVVAQSYQRTRWLNGAVFIWLGARKGTGRGEGASRLAFDQVVPAVPRR